jgi:phosphatidylserine decarboxylase
MAKEGIPILSVFLFVTLGMLLLYYTTKTNFFLYCFFISVFLSIFTAYFFRDPERAVPQEPGLIVSPADGKIIEICEEENKTLGGRARRVSIFLSVFNVHINRMPAQGKVESVKYYKGEFLAAWDEKASLKNEQTHIAIDCGRYKLLVKQIAGLIARRIVCKAHEGETYQRGDRIGMIKFGSRTDLFLPLEAELKVKTGDHVAGGTTVIAQMRE